MTFFACKHWQMRLILFIRYVFLRRSLVRSSGVRLCVTNEPKICVRNLLLVSNASVEQLEWNHVRRLLWYASIIFFNVGENHFLFTPIPSRKIQELYILEFCIIKNVHSKMVGMLSELGSWRIILIFWNDFFPWLLNGFYIFLLLQYNQGFWQERRKLDNNFIRRKMHTWKCVELLDEKAVL